MKHVLFCLLCFVIVPGIAQFKLYEKGHQSYTKEKYADAIGFFDEYLKKATRDKAIDVDVFYMRALSYYKLNKFQEAIPDFEETILRGHTNKGNIYWFMAKCYEQTGENDASLNSYNNAIRELNEKPDSRSKLLYERGLLHQKMGNPSLAVVDWQEGIASNPADIEIRKALDKLNIPAAGAKQTNGDATAGQTRKEIARNDRPGSKISKIDPSNKQSTPAGQATEEQAQRKEDNQKPAAETIPESNSQKHIAPPAPTLADIYKDEKRYALVVGVSNYPKAIGVLKNPVNDATDMARELEDSHFEVQLLTNATYGQIRAALMRFKEKLDGGDKDNTVGLFYFAGHGLLYDDENYLVPADASVQYEDDIPRYCFPIQRMVLNNMERSNTRMNIVILDACRNNPFPSLTRSAGRSGLGEMKRARGTFIAYATAPGSVAQDGTGRNGLYTQELLRALKKPGLTIEQVFKEVRANVLRLSADRQNTWDSSNIVGEFHFKY